MIHLLCENNFIYLITLIAMKKKLLFCLFTLFACLSPITIFAQNNTQAPTQNIYTLAPSVVINRPDLVVTSFTKGSTIFTNVTVNNKPYKRYTISYKAVVKNQGNAATMRSCDLGDPVEGIDGCAKIPILQPGQSATIEGSLTGEFAASLVAISPYMNIRVQADLPNCSYEDLPDATYGDINESNETNNKSQTITIHVP